MKKLRIIYIEDNLTDYEMVKAVLEEEGLLGDMIRVEKKDEFIINIQDFKPDIVLSDFNLPVFHGLEALEIMKTHHPEIPFIIVTGNLSDEIAVDLIKKGAWDYVLKENIVRLVPSINYSFELKKSREERAQALESLKESETNYRVLAESSPYGIIVHTDGKIVYFNKAARNIVSNDPDADLIGINLFEHIHPDNKEIGEERIHELYRGTNFPEPFEIKYINPEGVVLYLEVASASIMFKGKPAAQVIFRDINERKKFEKELLESKNRAVESDRLKTAFLENMSHEIRTPLNGIIGFSSLLKFKDLSQEDRDNYLKIIEDSGKHLLSIINDLIEISQIETGQIELREENFNLNSLMDELFVFYNNTDKYKKDSILLGLRTPLKNEDSLIRADKFRIKQVFINLLSNAFKFTPEGTIDFGYEIQDSIIRFYVKDTGIGIKDEAKELIFERFRQADESTTRMFGGNGLGLTISKAIVNAMGGEIWVESVPGTGSSFFFTVPYIMVAEKSKSKEELHHSANLMDWTGRTFLIAEDEKSNYTLLKHVLTRAGASVEHATNGKEVLELLNSGTSYDLILLDIKMPVMDGYETIAEIRRTGNNIPVVAQTAYAMHNDARTILDAGCNACITKPIRTPELFRIIEELLNG